jgi:hypothetical protein
VATIVTSIVSNNVAGIMAAIPQVMDIIQPNSTTVFSLSELDINFAFFYLTIGK